MQVQPVFASVVSVTPGEIAITPEEASRADGWAGCSPCAALPDDDIAPGPDGDAQAPIPNAPNTTNKVHARLNTFDMLHL
jgi:hypothetical protein